MSAGQRWAFWGFAGACAVLAVLEASVRGPLDDLATDLVWGLSWAAVLWGIRSYRPSAPGVWSLLGASVVASGTGGVLYQAIPGTLARHPALYAVPQSLLLLGFVCLLAGAVWASRRMSQRATVEDLVDLGLLIVAVGTVLWELVLRPLLASSELPAATRLATAAYPALDVVLLAVLARLLLLNPRRPWAVWAVMASAASSMASFLTQAVVAIHGSSGDLHWLLMGWLGSAALIGLAALHPSMCAVTQPSPSVPFTLGRGRSLALGCALLAPPLAVTLRVELMGLPFQPADLLIPSVLLTTLGLVRLRRLFRERERSEAALARRERWFRRLVEHQSDHVLVVDRAGTVTYQSPSISTLLGYGPDELVGGPSWRLMPDTERAAATALMRQAQQRPGETVPGRLLGRTAAGSSRAFEVTLTDLSGDPAVGAVVAVLHDVTERERFEEQLRHQALHDPLTGLPNRALVLDRAGRMLAAARRSQRPLAALFVDLDNFKGINDSLGHAAGDEVLIAVADRLLRAVREAATVGRLGGDEFVVLVEAGHEPGAAELVAERIRDVLRAPVQLSGRAYAMTASVGIAVRADGSAEDLLRDADIAMYGAKAAGKNQQVLFRHEMQVAAQTRLEMETDLRGAVAGGELALVFQPAVDLRDLTVTGMEALVRWQHPARGLVSPGDFIPLAEETGLIGDIGRWVLRQACAAAAAWPQAGTALSVAVNVSARQLESDQLVDDVGSALAESGLDPRRLVLEVTETAIMRDAATVAGRIRALKALGVRVAIDDFGTGYSSLSYLRQFPVDVLKIDRSFIASVHDSAEAVAVVHTLVELGKTLNLEIVAEGVEVESQLTALRQEQCDTAQGYLFARPIEGAQLERFLREWSLGGPGGPAAVAAAAAG